MNLSSNLRYHLIVSSNIGQSVAAVDILVDILVDITTLFGVKRPNCILDKEASTFTSLTHYLDTPALFPLVAKSS